MQFLNDPIFNLALNDVLYKLYLKWLAFANLLRG